MRLRLPALLFLLVVLLNPISAFAQGENSMFDPIIPEDCKCGSVPIIGTDGAPTGQVSPSAPNWGCVLKVMQNVINTAVGIAILIVVLAIVYAAFIFMTRGGNPSARQQGRNVIGNSLLGLLILLGAWLGVDFVMKMVYDPTAVVSGDTKLGPWNAIWASSGDDMCIVVKEPLPIATGVIGFVVDVVRGPSSGGGTCTPPSAGPCSPSNLSSYFGAAASQAAMICNAESGGVINRPSQTDKMRNDPKRRSFSFGLFQINITQHSVAGLDCPSAFNGKNYAATVKNEDLYRRCAAAAQTEQHNVAEAVATYKRTNWREWSTARQCGLAMSMPRHLVYNN